MGGALWFFWPSSQEPQTNTTSLTPGSSVGNNQTSVSVPSTNVTTGESQNLEKIQLPTVDGTGVYVNNFLPPGATLESSDGGDIYITQDSASPEEDLYRLSFYMPSQNFSVILLKEPLREIRRFAESDLIEKLGISERDACRLFYFVSTHTEVSPFYAGKNLGFSFCPGSIQL